MRQPQYLSVASSPSVSRGYFVQYSCHHSGMSSGSDFGVEKLSIHVSRCILPSSHLSTFLTLFVGSLVV